MSFGRRFARLVGLQVVLVLSLVAWKQWTVVTGQTIWLRSAPMDPRDLFRGEYVALQHDISTVDEGVFYRSSESMGSVDTLFKRVRRGDVLYVSLQRDGAYWIAESVSTTPPSDAVVFLKARVVDVQPRMQTPTYAMGSVRVEYGIESWFVQRGQGPELERAARDKGKMLAVQVNVDRNGRGVLRSVRVARRDRPVPSSFGQPPAPEAPTSKPRGAAAPKAPPSAAPPTSPRQRDTPPTGKR